MGAGVRRRGKEQATSKHALAIVVHERYRHLLPVGPTPTTFDALPSGTLHFIATYLDTNDLLR
jgi:hypothetical protein